MESAGRFFEIDLFRGIAILMMILFHTVFDLRFFRIMSIDVSSGFWWYFALATASLFLLITGVSLTISYSRAAQQLSGFALTKKFLLRGVFIFACGLLVTLVTYLYLGTGFVVFGILHLIGVSIMLSVLFFRFRGWNILAGVVVIVTGIFCAGVTGPLWLLPLGIHPAGFFSVDYTPLFPWFGMVLIGMGAGSLLYPSGVRRWGVPPLPQGAVQPLVFLGRHSLLVYLLHQPVILLLLAAVTGTKIL